MVYTQAREITRHLDWAWQTERQRHRLTKAIDAWLTTFDPEGKSEEQLADEFARGLDPVELAGPRRGYINAIRSLFMQNGDLHITIWRTDGSDHAYEFPARRGIMAQLKQLEAVAKIQVGLAKYGHQQIMVQWLDLDDLPRAFAAGPRWSKDKLRDMAQGNLYLHLERKKEIDPDVLPENFREVIIEVEGYE